jgi:hypothetical protein
MGTREEEENDTFNLTVCFHRHLMIFRDPILKILEIEVPSDQRQSFYLQFYDLNIKLIMVY